MLPSLGVSSLDSQGPGQPLGPLSFNPRAGCASQGRALRALAACVLFSSLLSSTHGPPRLHHPIRHAPICPGHRVRPMRAARGIRCEALKRAHNALVAHEDMMEQMCRGELTELVGIKYELAQE